MTESIEPILLRGQVPMPALGLGVYQMSPSQAASAVETALGVGYRHVDTAAAYNNEDGVAKGLARSGVERDQVFLTTKAWVSDYGNDALRYAFDRSARHLRTEVLDLYLLHQPLPMAFDDTLAAWRAAAELRDEGRARAIGVSNFTVGLLERLIDATGVVPDVHQIELHPYFPQADLQAFHGRHGIATQAWSPLGGVLRYWDADQHDDPLVDPRVVAIAESHGVTPAQVLLRWQLQLGHCVIPKSMNPGRIRENGDLAGFVLDPRAMELLNSMDRGRRGGPDPEALDFRTFGVELVD